MRCSQLLLSVLVSVAPGCVGAFAGYGPGMTNEARLNTGCVPDAPGSSYGTCTTTSYNSGDLEYGIQLGARVGAITASAGDIKSGKGMGVDAHTDIVVANAKYGGGVSVGYSSDRIIGGEGPSMFYWGIPLTLYGQYGLSRRIFVHAGGGRVLHGTVKRIEPDELSVPASAWRGVAGITFVFSRDPHKDLAFRLEFRAQHSAAATIDAMDATWSSAGVLGEIVWASF